MKNSAQAMMGMGLISGTKAVAAKNSITHAPEKSADFPDNPLVLFDNFHVGNRRSYSWKAKFNSAMAAGFDGYEIVMVEPGSDRWKEAMDLVPTTSFKLWGFHWTTKAVLDSQADKINGEIEKIISNVEACGKSPLKPYFTLSLSGRGELDGPTIAERGSAKAEERHWKRAYKIISAFDKACADNGVSGSLYPHIDWICDTPQSQVKIIEGAEAKHIGPAFCSHHWYANKNSDELDQVFQYPLIQRLNYVVLTNGQFRPSGFNAVRFDEGQIDMAWMLAKLYKLGYEGPISSQGWGIGGDPFVSCKRFVEGVKGLRKRFIDHPELNPLM